MANIGEIRGRMNDNGNTVYDGYLSTFKHFVQFWLEPVPSERRTSDRAPGYTIMAKGEHGRPVAVGDVWANSINRGASAGKRMLSLNFTDPAFEGLAASAFPTGMLIGEYTEHYEMQLDRKRGDNAEERNKEQQAA